MLLVCLLAAAGCGDVYHLATLRSGLSREFPDASVGVSLASGLNLTVTLVDGSLPDAPCGSQAALALRVADYVRRNYQEFDSLWTVSVALAHRPPDGPTTATITRLPFRFSRTALQTGLLAADSASAVALCELDSGRPPADSR
jgi:hypothetical protein